MSDEIEIGSVVNLSELEKKMVDAMTKDYCELMQGIRLLLRESSRNEDKFWEFIKGSYPELKGWEIRYFRKDGAVMVIRREKEEN